MLSKTQEQAIDDKKKVLRQLMADYKAMLKLPWSAIKPKDPALVDIIHQLDAWATEAKTKADSELDDSVKVMVFLHEFNVYVRIKEYIEKQLS
jgi:hypothetical protein